jgi:hypothetical protein
VIRLAPVVAIARAELRLTRRLARYRVFLVLACLIGFLVYLQLSLIHGFGSTYSSSLSTFSPRFLVSAMGFRYLVIFIIGSVFLGFDVRARDQRERVAEVLDSRPYTNLELMVGKLVALLAASWVPLVVLAILLNGLGFLLRALGVPIGEPIEPMSLIGLALAMALPGLAFALALVFLVALLVRNRLVAAVIVLAIVAGSFYITLGLPLVYAPLVDLVGATTLKFPSDIIPSIADGVGWLQRFAVLVFAAGMLILAAAVHPRLDGGSRLRTALSGGVTMVVAFAMLFGAHLERRGTIDQLERWKQAHAARSGEPVPDIVSVSADVGVWPGRRLTVDTELLLRAPLEHDLASVLLTLNPGLEVQEVSGGDGPLRFSHDNGLLDLDLPLAAGAESRVRVRAEGSPDIRFAYLDATLIPEAANALEGGVGLLGIDRALWDRRFVALMPDMGWLPLAGGGVGRSDTRKRPRDYFDVDLTAEVPEGWLAAGPGRRRELSSSRNRVRFAFSPGAPVPETALIASRFSSYSTEINGVSMEALFHPKHSRNIEVLRAASDELILTIAERLSELEELGLGYPYDGFTLVEVPTALRTFGGGWRLDTALAPPSIGMVRETGFTTARFDVAFRDPERWRDREGGMPRAMRDRIYAFFLNDFLGGNILVGAARNFFVYQSCATGMDAIPLNFTLEELTTLLVTGARGYFSIHMFGDNFQSNIQTVLRSLGRIERPEQVAERVIDALSNRPEIWEAVLSGSLRELDPWQDPGRTIDALTLKGGALARSLYDGMDRQAVGDLLAGLRESHRGGTFGLDEMVSAGETLEEELGEVFTDWLTTTSLPGFVAERATVFRLAESEDGRPRYQLLLTVRNHEAVPGMIRFGCAVGSGKSFSRITSDPIRVAGRSRVQYGVVLSEPAAWAWADPYLALNREDIAIKLPEFDEERIVDEDPLNGSREIEWRVPDSDIVTVDDLDDGFEVTEGSGRSGIRSGGRERTTHLEQGLPQLPQFTFGRPPARWSRRIAPAAFGRYRHTYVLTRPGKGERTATFPALIPRAGDWTLEIHLPMKIFYRGVREKGTWNLEVEDASGIRGVVFDADAAVWGWNTAETLTLAEGKVLLRLSDDTDGDIVVADAIRWVPTAHEGLSEE